MTIETTTHLNFADGRAREALDFYASAFGGTVTATTYGELGMPADAPDAARIVFGRVESPAGLRLMAYDVPGAPGPNAGGSARRENGATLTDQPFFVSVRGTSLDEVRGYWDHLAEGATVVEPLAASAWSAGFGMLTDRFGVTWVLDVA
jgi:PhnB protein